jgi:hypothetical protein
MLHFPTEIKSYLFDASLVIREDIIDFLKSQSVGTAHAYTGAGIRELLYHIKPGEIAAFDASDIAPSFFLNSAELSVVEETIVKACQKYSELNAFHDFTIQFAQPDTRIVVNIAPSQIFAFVVSDKKYEYYFDFVAQSPVEVCNYSQTNSIVGMHHSGDVGDLLHTLTYRGMFPKVLLAAVGYKSRRLRYFTDQVPTFVIVDNENMVVPVPLDEATLGDATFSGMVVAEQIRKSQIEFTILRSPVCAHNKDTCDHCPDKVHEAISEAVATDDLLPQASLANHFSSSSGAVPAAITILSKPKLQSIVRYVQDGIDDLLPIENCSIFNFGTVVQAFEHEWPEAICQSSNSLWCCQRCKRSCSVPNFELSYSYASRSRRQARRCTREQELARLCSDSFSIKVQWLVHYTRQYKRHRIRMWYEKQRRSGRHHELFMCEWVVYGGAERDRRGPTRW